MKSNRYRGSDWKDYPYYLCSDMSRSNGTQDLLLELNLSADKLCLSIFYVYDAKPVEPVLTIAAECCPPPLTYWILHAALAPPPPPVVPPPPSSVVVEVALLVSLLASLLISAQELLYASR
jgi:hypothetical protein